MRRPWHTGAIMRRPWHTGAIMRRPWHTGAIWGGKIICGRSGMGETWTGWLWPGLGTGGGML